MRFPELLFLAIGLSMDAFAVSIVKGLSLKKITLKSALIPGLWFGAFQALMPLIGYFLGVSFQQLVASVDHWITFGLLTLIGANMIREARSDEEEEVSASLSARAMFPLAVATSIDALAVGVTFAFLSIAVLPAVTLIGCTTFIIASAGVYIGRRFGSRFEQKAEIAGGIILIFLGVRILIEHLFF